MATKVHMEALSPTMEEGQVVKWLKKQGDDVASGDVLAEIETDKATMELVARGDGVLRAIFVDEGGVVPVGEVIGVIAGADEDIEELIPAGAGAASGPAGDGSSDETSAAEPASSAGSSEAAAASPQASGSESSTTAPAPGAQPRAEEGTAAPSGNGRVKASPLARRLAEEAGVDLAAVSGSGPGGRVVKTDI
jgi:pyruvate dehydrogenase E2 component (dihydrolipoamide acetyltransferase)